MQQNTNASPYQPDFLFGNWTYRSLLNDTDLNTPFNNLEFGLGTVRMDPAPANQFKGLIWGPGWQLELKGSIQYGAPAQVWFQGQGVVGGSLWIYDYLGYVVPLWPNGVNQVPAITGSICRAIPHPDGSGGTSPAGVVCTFYMVKQP